MVENSDFTELCLECGAQSGGVPNQSGGVSIKVGSKDGAPARCAKCGGRRRIAHPELAALAIAHIDCDAFYASIEKRDAPELADLPVIVGGDVRGVVTTACYIARTYGVRSAMPMFKARALCPNAVVIKPHFEKYSAAAREVRALMLALTPLVEPVSIDEAFLDLSGTARIHKRSPAASLAFLQRRVKDEIGITVSVGLSFNKFLAKTASDFDKPNGFSVIGKTDARAVLARLPVGAIWGVGAVMAKRLAADGFSTVADLQKADPAFLARRYGEMGLRLADLCVGRDTRPVSTEHDTKSVSAETTFNEDIRDIKALDDFLWSLCERCAARMKEKKLEGRVVTLKLKTADFRTLTRRTTLASASNLARTLYDAASPLLKETSGGRAFRLIGVGYFALQPAAAAIQADMFDGAGAKMRKEEDAIDAIRAKFGKDAIALGRFYAKKHAKDGKQPIAKHPAGKSPAGKMRDGPLDEED